MCLEAPAAHVLAFATLADQNCIAIPSEMQKGGTMSVEFDWNPEVTERASRQSLIEAFTIEGLYGYRTISLSSEFSATVLIAKNGTGKTTLLGALDALLRLQFSRLRNVEFREMRLKLRAFHNEIVLRQDDVVDFLRVPDEGEIIRLANRAGVETLDLFNFIIDEFTSDFTENSGYSEHPVFSKLMRIYGWGTREPLNACRKIFEELLGRNASIALISAEIRSALKDYDIVYLPTYRRVELALTDTAPSTRPTSKARSKFSIAKGGLFNGNIQFGLSDIAERLSDLNQRIIVESNRGYREISANIINELIDGSYEISPSNEDEVPTKSEMELFFARLREGGRMGPYPTVAPPNLDKLFSEKEVPENSRVFLEYFLRKLAKVIRTTKAIEMPVDEFIRICNKYLTSSEPTTSLEGMRFVDQDRKQLNLNRANLKVTVECLPEGRRIPLDSLSSGEKQMISLFSKLFLYPKRKIVLIDEPELSLSIDWQRDILRDVLAAPLCDQLISITHSPFVFDNELEPFARMVNSHREAASYSDTESIDGGDIDYDFDFELGGGDE